MVEDKLKEIRDRTPVEQKLFQNIFMTLIDAQFNENPDFIPKNHDFKGLENDYKDLAIKLTKEVIAIINEYKN